MTAAPPVRRAEGGAAPGPDGERVGAAAGKRLKESGTLENLQRSFSRNQELSVGLCFHLAAQWNPETMMVVEVVEVMEVAA